MDKYRRVREYSAKQRPSAVAASVHGDFAALISMLEDQLANVGDTDERAREHIVQAKAAAERGLRLSAKLVDLTEEEQIKN